jgi:3-dehydroquinate synthase
VQVPTTFLAQIDSSIGGKTAVDLAGAKNLAGTFYQPRLVACDVALLPSLSARQMRAGLSEAIKYAVIKDPVLFSFLEKNLARIRAGDLRVLAQVVERCVRIKAGIVSKDEREEKGLRTVLNFGHTIGHAVEAAGRFGRYNHGEAVALGMLVACGISRRLRIADARDLDRIESLIARSGLPTRIRGVSGAAIVKAHYHDKKFKGAVNRFVLVRAIGDCIVRTGIALDVIRQAVQERF